VECACRQQGGDKWDRKIAHTLIDAGCTEEVGEHGILKFSTIFVPWAHVCMSCKDTPGANRTNVGQADEGVRGEGPGAAAIVAQTEKVTCTILQNEEQNCTPKVYTVSIICIVRMYAVSVCMF